MTFTASILSPDIVNLFALLAVVFIGLPHGAMDGALAVHFGWLGRPYKAALFLLSYVGLAALVVVAWALAPVFSFIGFLAISAYHFGRGDATTIIPGRHVVESMARGGLVIAGISQFHRTEVNEVFLTVVGADTTWIWLFLDGLTVLTVGCIVEALVFKERQKRQRFALEMGGSPSFSLPFLPWPVLQFTFAWSTRFATSHPCVDFTIHGIEPANHPNDGGVFSAHVGRWPVGLGPTIGEHWR